MPSRGPKARRTIEIDRSNRSRKVRSAMTGDLYIGDAPYYLAPDGKVGQDASRLFATPLPK